MSLPCDVLITGGTGSFGRAFAKFLLTQDHIERVLIYSRGEHAQADMRAEFRNDPRLRWMIGDVRDVDRLRRAMSGVDTVVHAAALKRIEVGAYNPDEMVKTNVMGTMNVIEAAAARHVHRVIGLSSDKAFQPISPYGHSKALAESLLLGANTMFGRRGPKFSCTRYGNIWNAQGSVVPKWRKMAEEGAERVPVSNLECTRFFMTIGQAVALVWSLVNDMRGGELVIPTDLPAYKLADLLEAFDVEGVETGLPVWEKLHESMALGLCSADARRMTVAELRSHLEFTK